MTIKTRAIVIASIKYSEADLIVTCFTEKAGIITFLLKNVLKSKLGPIKPSFFQPLTQLDIVATNRDKGTMEYLREVKVDKPYFSIHTDILKASVSVFLTEVLKKAIQEEQSNPELFLFLKQSLDWFDSNQDFANFHISFLLKLTSFLGFDPDIASSNLPIFNMMEGKFESSPSDIYSTDDEIVKLFSSFLKLSYQESSEIKLSRVQRNKLLDFIITYYQLHIQGFSKPKSLPILQQIFK